MIILNLNKEFRIDDDWVGHIDSDNRKVFSIENYFKIILKWLKKLLLFVGLKSYLQWFLWTNSNDFILFYDLNLVFFEKIRIEKLQQKKVHCLILPFY